MKGPETIMEGSINVKKPEGEKEKVPSSPFENIANVISMAEKGAPSKLEELEPLKKLFKQINEKDYSMDDLSQYIDGLNNLGLALARLELNIRQRERLEKTQVLNPEKIGKVDWPIIKEVIESAAEEAAKKLKPEVKLN